MEDRIKIFADLLRRINYLLTVTSIRSNTEGITYKKKVSKREIQISRGCKDKCHVYNAMYAKVTFQTSYSVATGLF